MIKRQAAFENAGKMLKGGLHCHTTRSDGKGTPEEVCKLHEENGYDFLALTDHRNYNYANYGDSRLTIIPGMEMDGTFSVPGYGMCHHHVCIGPAKADGNPYEQDQRFDSWKLTRPEDSQPMLDKLHENKNLTIYCHPEWSGTPCTSFDMLKGNFAMEIWNSGCVIEDELDYNAPYWDEMLASGHRIWGVATDDGHAMDQHCNGWVRVNSENNINAILDALRDGRFYASTGPEIYDFYVEDGVAHVKCSPAVSIGFRHMTIPYRFTKAEDGTTITEANVNIRRSRFSVCQYIRAVVTDEDGNRAWTNPIFLDEDDFASIQ